jgi:hypothetical protein
MRAEPGKLSDFGPNAHEAWDNLHAEKFANNGSQQALAKPDERTKSNATVDWGAFPVRAEVCLGSRDQALKLLDWRTDDSGDRGRAAAQEEYLEWRVVRDDNDTIQRVELTSEFREYWETLAAHHPQRTLELIRGFADEDEIDPGEVYDGLDPLDDNVTPAKRRNAFIVAMEPDARGRPPRSQYNNGAKAITCMCRDDNTLTALIALVLKAVFPYVADDDGEPLSGSEAIAATDQSALDCRNSDPTVVGKLIDLAAHGHFVALDDPIGVYIVDVQNERLEMPDGQPVPLGWFDRSRGSRANDVDKLERSQRVTFELPGDADFGIEQLVDRRTDRKIKHGGQIADLITLGVHARISPPDAVEDLEKIRVARPDVTPCAQSPGCQPFRSAWDEFERSADPVP